MSRVLLISYLFPPLGGVGVQRALSLAKYLPKSGCEVHILKARNAAGPVYDPALLSQVPAEVRIDSAFTPELPFHFRQNVWKWFGGKTKSQPVGDGKVKQQPGGWKRWPRELIRRVLCPEPEVLWFPFAFSKAKRIIRRSKIDTLLVTAPPFSAFLVGNALKRKFPNLKLITDFRDDWLRFYLGEYEFQNSDYTRRKAVAIERKTVELSDRVVVVTETMLEHIRARYPGQQSGKFVFIPNGYDPEAFEAFQPRPHDQPKIVVSHIGTVYSASSPRYYLDALDEVDEGIRGMFETRFIGRVADDQKPFLDNRRSALKVLGFMPQEQALRQMEATDYLLLVMTDAASLTGKLFEYLATGKPILAIAQRDSEVARILQHTGAGWCAAPDDKRGILKLILLAHQLKTQQRKSFAPNWTAIRRFERPRLAREFARLIAN